MRLISVFIILVLFINFSMALAQISADGSATSEYEFQSNLQRQAPSDVLVNQQRGALPQLFPREYEPKNGDVVGFTISEWHKKIAMVMIPAEPEGTSDDMKAEALGLSAGCTANISFPCDDAEALLRAAKDMAEAGKASPECDSAAANFRVAYESLKVSDEVARDYDLACLGSFATRSREAADDADKYRPVILQGAEQPGGLLDLVGLLEVNGEVVCGGLLRPDRTFVTARHCIRGLGDVPLKVRSASKRFPVMAVKAQRHPDWSELGVAADWAVLQLEAGPPLQVPLSRLTALRRPGEITLIGYYRHAQSTSYASGNVSFERDLRYPKQGLCQAIEDLSNCLQIACQTVRGFSGTPIFSGRRADGSVDVIGFLSASGADTGCKMNSNIKFSTFAVSARAILED